MNNEETKTRRRGTPVLVIAVVLLLGFVVWRCLPGPKPQTCRLPDGSTLTLKRVTCGEVHRERAGGRWRDRLVPLLPERLARRLGCTFVSAGGTNTLVFWLEHRGTTGGSAPRLSATTVDEHGCEFRMTQDSGAYYLAANRALQFVSFDEFPRRAKTIGLRLFLMQTNGIDVKVAEFTVPNPDPRSHPTWQPEPYPITRTVDNVAFTLADLKGGVQGNTSPPQLPEPGQDVGFLLLFRVTESGRPSASWSVASVQGLADASGQTVGRGGYGVSSLDRGELAVNIRGGLCLEESALSLRVEFAKERDFAREEVWTVKGIPVPDVHSASHIDATNTIHGVDLRVQGITGLQCPGPEPRRSLRSWPVLGLTAVNLRPNLKLILVEAVDDQGRAASASVNASTPTNHAFALNLAPDAQTVDATFAVTRTVAVEYLARPSRITTDELQSLRRKLGAP